MGTANSLHAQNGEYNEKFDFIHSFMYFIRPTVKQYKYLKYTTKNSIGQGDCEGTLRSSSQAATLKTK